MTKRLSQQNHDKARFDNEIFQSRNALSIGKIFPNVQKVVIEYVRDTRVFSSYKDETAVMVNLLPNNPFSIIISCKNSTCTGLGYELTQVVREAMRKEKTEVEGKMRCNGYEDAERHGQYSCDSEIEYKNKYYL